MTKNKWIGVALAVLALAAAIVWVFGSPYYTLMQMRDAARANDADKLSAYIDYDALRDDLKSDVTARLAAEAQEDQSAAGALGLAIGSVLAAPLVDRMVSPAGVRAMLVASKDREAQRGPAPAPKAPVKVDDKPVVERRGFAEFAVRSKDDGNGAMIFTRHGLGWKLSGVDLPPAGTE